MAACCHKYLHTDTSRWLVKQWQANNVCYVFLRVEEHLWKLFDVNAQKIIRRDIPFQLLSPSIAGESLGDDAFFPSFISDIKHRLQVKHIILGMDSHFLTFDMTHIYVPVIMFLVSYLQKTIHSLVFSWPIPLFLSACSYLSSPS